MRLNLTGQRFGRLFVMAFDRVDASHRAHWRALCDCGRETVVSTTHLRSGHTQSCGCMHRESVASIKFRHGCAREGARSPSYNTWASMIKRCTNPSAKEFENYGGRGIAVCDRWRDFAVFLADMGERPPGRTLDRINNNGNYEPGNCRWATYVEQARNRRPRRRHARRAA